MRRSLTLWICSLLLFPPFARSQSQDPAQRLKDLQNQIDLLNKQIEKLTAEKKLQDLSKPVSAKDKALDDQNSELQKRLAIAQSEQKLLQASLPTPTAKPLEGKLTIDEKVTIEGDILTYESLHNAVKDIASVINKADPSTKNIVVYSDKDVLALQLYPIVTNRLTELTRAYDNLLKTEGSTDAELAIPPTLLPDTASTLLRSLVDVISLFRTDVSVTGRAVLIPEDAVVAQLARSLSLNNQNISFTYPALVPPTVPGPSGLIQAIDELYKQMGKAQSSIAKYDAESPEDQKKDKLRSRVSQLKALNDTTDKFVADLIKPSDAAGLSPLISLIRAENIKALLNDAPSYLLYVKVQTASENNKSTHNLFTGSHFSQSGGVVVTCFLFDVQGHVRASKVTYSYSGYKDSTPRNGGGMDNFEK